MKRIVQNEHHEPSRPVVLVVLETLCVELWTLPIRDLHKYTSKFNICRTKNFDKVLNFGPSLVPIKVNEFNRDFSYILSIFSKR